MPLPLIYHRCVVMYSLILTLFIKRKPKHIEIHPVSNQCRFSTDACLSGFVCMLWYSKRNTNRNFSYVKMLSCGAAGGILYIKGRGRATPLQVSIFYLFHIYLYPSLEVLYDLKHLFFCNQLFIFWKKKRNVILMQTSFKTLRQSELQVVNICEMLSIYLLIS